MNLLYKIPVTFVILFFPIAAMDRPDESSHLKLLPAHVLSNLLNYFNSAAPELRMDMASGEIRGRDNRSDILIEVGKNNHTFNQVCDYLFGIVPNANENNADACIEQLAEFLKAHPKEQTFYLKNEISIAGILLNTKKTKQLIDKKIQRKIETFKALDQYEKNKTAIDLIRHNPSRKLLLQLLEGGAHINASEDESRFTFLRYAVEAKRYKLLQLLLAKGADPNKPDVYNIMPLQRAIMLEHEEMVKALLENNARVNVLDFNGRTPIMCAARSGNIKIFDALLAKGANIFLTDDAHTKKNVFVETVKSGSLSIWEKLMACEPTPGTEFLRELFVNMAFKKAAQLGCTQMIKALLADGKGEKIFKGHFKPDLRLDLVKSNETALSCAISAGHSDIALLFLNYARDLYYKGIPGYKTARGYALSLAVHKKINPQRGSHDKDAEYQKIIDALLDEDADPLDTTYGFSACYCAAAHSQKQLFDQLLSHATLQEYKKKGLNGSAIDIELFKSTESKILAKLLLQATQTGSAPAVRHLLVSGAQASYSDTFSGDTALHKAVVVANRHSLQMIYDLCTEAKDAINTVNKAGDTPLHRLMKNVNAKEREQIAQILLENGADLSVANAHGDSVLITAIKTNAPQLTLVRLLLDWISHRASSITVQEYANWKNKNGDTALMCAAAKGRSYKEIVELLLKNGADPNSKNNSGCGALTKAARSGSEDIIELLKRNGARLRDFKDGMLREAVKGGYLKLIERLVAEGADLDGVSSSWGNTPLHKAIEKKQPEALKLLLEKGANHRKKNRKGETPLEYAMILGARDMVNILLKQK